MAKEPESLPAGIYLVATPIGNLGDISDRQRQIIEACDVVDPPRGTVLACAQM